MIIVQFTPMATILQRLLVERAAQCAEEARPPFCSVDALRTFIEEHAPAQYENVSVEMCVLRMEDRQMCWKLDLIDKELEPDFDALASASASLDSARRNKFVFQLNLWKTSNPFFNDITCCEGWSYRFEKVHSLNLRYGSPTGSIQLRQGTRIVRIHQDAAAAVTTPKLPEAVGTATTDQDGGDTAATSTRAFNSKKSIGAANLAGDSAVGTSGQKTDAAIGPHNLQTANKSYAAHSTSAAESVNEVPTGSHLGTDRGNISPATREVTDEASTMVGSSGTLLAPVSVSEQSRAHAMETISTTPSQSMAPLVSISPFGARRATSQLPKRKARDPRVRDQDDLVAKRARGIGF
jgi:hypothetical protein